MRARLILPLVATITAGTLGAGALLHTQPDALAQTPQQVDAQSPQPPFELVLPIACEPGQSCFLQSYMDHDPGPGAQDYMCRGQTYDGHKGTDFRVADLAAATDISVLAAASGTVIATRNHLADHTIGDIDFGTVSDVECGNGLVIDHGAGWQTQYCHMRQGSVLVEASQTVSAGQELGLVGLSGKTEFAHLHFSVRKDGQEIDPFAPAFGPDQCEGEPRNIWKTQRTGSLGYTRSAIINIGFSAGPVSMDDIEQGKIAEPARDADALIAYGRAINLRAGDVLELAVQGPSGEIMARTATEQLNRNKAQWMLFTGRRLRAAAWPAGDYTATLTISNDGAKITEHRFTLTLND